MSDSSGNPSNAIHQQARRVRLACFDVDGTLTDGRLYFDSHGLELKAFHVHDGQGLKLLQQAGIAVAFVTARSSPIAERRATELGAEAYTCIADKLDCVRGIAGRHGLAMEQVAFMGDDLPDLKVMPHVGLCAAPADAHRWVRERVHWRAAARGGHGAVREFCDLLLEAQGKLDAVLDAVLECAPGSGASA